MLASLPVTVVPALVLLTVGVGVALVLNRRSKNADLFDAELGLKPYCPPAEPVPPTLLDFHVGVRPEDLYYGPLGNQPPRDITVPPETEG